jgi:hypothetical protein
MYIFDEKDFPIVNLTSRGQATLEDAEYYVESMNRLLARQERFGLLMYDESGEDNNRDNRVANYTVKWMKEARPQIGLYCAGIAAVTANEDYRAKYGPMMEERGEQIYGCPAKIFAASDEEAARQWLQVRLAVSPPA